MIRSRFYWPLQCLAWSAYGAINYSLAVAYHAGGSAPVLVCVTLAVSLLAASHVLRELALRRKWLEQPPLGLLWRLGTAILALALAVQVTIYGVTTLALRLDLVTMPTGTVITRYSMPMLWVYWFNTSVMLALWTMAWLTYIWLERWRSGQIEHWRTESALREAELALLRAQLDSHFLFNALNNIRAAVSESPDRAREMITHLSHVLRYVLQYTRRQRVTLREELETVRNYLALIGLHFEDRLTVRESVDPSALEFEIPPMLLQLLVENAIKHGVAKTDRGAVAISIARHDDGVRIEVINDGSLDRTGEGVGLINLRQRLAHGFGKRVDVHLEQIGGRVVARVTI